MTTNQSDGDARQADKVPHPVMKDFNGNPIMVPKKELKAEAAVQQRSGEALCKAIGEIHERGRRAFQTLSKHEKRGSVTAIMYYTGLVEGYRESEELLHRFCKTENAASSSLDGDDS